MLACGQTCQPNIIEREINPLSSNASPIQVLTDAGIGFVKAPNNSNGAGMVIAELVAAELGSWFGLNIPPFAIVRNCEIDLRMARNGEAMQAPLFFSKQVDGISYDGSETLVSKIRNKEDIAKLVVFDTWICNWDRYEHPHENYDNLLFVKDKRKYDIYAIDHTYAFNGEFPVGLNNEMISEESVYGNFPNFAPYIDYNTITSALEKLSQLDRDFVEQIVNSVPTEWGLGEIASQSLTELICRRAEFVVNTLPARIIVDPPIPGIQGNGQ